MHQPKSFTSLFWNICKLVNFQTDKISKKIYQMTKNNQSNKHQSINVSSGPFRKFSTCVQQNACILLGMQWCVMRIFLFPRFYNFIKGIVYIDIWYKYIHILYIIYIHTHTHTHIYIYIAPPHYNHSGFVATHALGHMMLGSSCFCEIWSLCVSWITYDHLHIYIYYIYIIYTYIYSICIVYI